VVVHGGAGSWTDGEAPAAEAGVAAAVRTALAVLAAGGRSLDASQAAVRVLEDDPVFNAGVGSALTRDGTVEVDAALMEGETLRIGAIGAVEGALRPIELARAVLEDGEHVLLVGPAVWDFARERGIEPAPPGALVTEGARRRWQEGQRKRQTGGGTVGACAIDRLGHVAAATSTGGIQHKRRGRVGDTPLAGCGTYADDRGGAASATGHGESIIRVTMSRTAVELLRAGASAAEAARAAIVELGDRVHGRGGIICVDRHGQLGLAHNTPAMVWGWATADRPEPVTGVRVVDRGP
jgi:beta-aspartyl-peptidase (threonine type)